MDPTKRYSAIGPDGPIEYVVVRSSRRRRTVSVGVERERGVVVRAPLRMPLREIQALVVKHARWIAGRLASFAVSTAPSLAHGAPLLFLGCAFHLSLVTAPDRKASALLHGRDLEVRVPETWPPEVHESGIRNILENWYRARAATRLPTRVVRWAEKMGATPTAILVRDQRRRWGSCSRDGTIRLNWRLVMAPLGLIDYVVVHELAHLRVPNHSPAFWAEVGRTLPEFAARRAELNRLGPRLTF